MCRKVFEDLTSDEFVISVGLVSTPEALRRFLLRSHAIHSIRESLRQGVITDETIRQFISSLMKEFSVGQRFVHEMALAALVVALERRPTNYAEEFISDLAKLRLAEMPLCIRIGRECRKHRKTLAQNKGRSSSCFGFREVPFQKVEPSWFGSSHQIETIRKANVFEANYANA